MYLQRRRILHYPVAPLSIRRQFGSVELGENQCRREDHLVHYPPRLYDLQVHLHLYHR